MEINSGNLVLAREAKGGKATSATDTPTEGAGGKTADPFAALLALLDPPPAASLLGGSMGEPPAQKNAAGGNAGAASGPPGGSRGAMVPDLLSGLLGGPPVPGSGRPATPAGSDPALLAVVQASAARAGQAAPSRSTGAAATPTAPDPRPIGGIPGGLGTTAPAAAGADGGKPAPPGANTANTLATTSGPIPDPAPTPPADGRQPSTGTTAPFVPGGRPIAAAGWLGISAPGDTEKTPGRAPQAPSTSPASTTDAAPAQVTAAPSTPTTTDPTAALAAGLQVTTAGPSAATGAPGGLPTGLLDGARTGDSPEATGSRYAAEPAHIRAQVVRQLAAENAAPGQARNLTLRLEPEHLGKVEVRITATDDGLEVVFRAETAAAQDALRDRSGELARALGAADARWQKVEIKVSEPAGSRSDPEEPDEDGSQDQPRRDQQESRDRRDGDDR